ncbi:universal stress protein [Methanohalophilus portucalensis]|uniref:Universal stress protein n=3 Tax=Methanohalophilus portucalensis TaxID=39664 RepID=A0A3M9LKP1_9EURY|nr:universal stress protein [Methanohalophilus portucalensis]RNI13585.1 universal stress protein [Methanohalophilus portucalensis FDF-1]
MNDMAEINTVLVAFSATSIHRNLAKAALDMAEEKDARLIILNVRDKNMAEKVARVTKDQGFMGRGVVEKLAADIKRDRDELIAQRLGMVEEEAGKRGIEFETVKVKGDFVKQVIETAGMYGADVVMVASSSVVNDIEKKIDAEVYSFE